MNRYTARICNFTLASLFLGILSCNQDASYLSAEAPEQSTSNNTREAAGTTKNQPVEPKKTIPTQTKIQTELGPEAVFDEKTGTYTITILESKIKWPTDLMIVVDNSQSMKEIQNSTATTVTRLLEEAARADLNLSVRLYSSTDMSTSSAPPISMGAYSLSLFNTSRSTNGPRGNSVFGPRSFFEMINGVSTNINSIKTDGIGSFWIRDEIVLGKSHFTSPSTNGVLHFQEGMNPTLAQQQVTQAGADISGLGIDGSDIEQYLAPVYRDAIAMSNDNQRRQAIFVVGNEDDQTRKGLLTGVNTEIKAATSVQFFGRVLFSQISYSFQLTTPAVLKDGVQISPAKEETGYHVSQVFGCGTAANKDTCDLDATKINISKPCNALQIAHAKQKLIEATKTNPSFREGPNPICAATTMVTYVKEIKSNNLTDSCDSLAPSSTKSISQSLFDLNSVTEVPATPACEKRFFRPYNLGSLERVSEIAGVTNLDEIGTQEIGDSIIRNLNKKVGPKGWVFGLIANDGINNCGQGTFSLPTRLDAFLAKTPKPNLRTSVCNNNYWTSVGSALLDFISSSSILSYIASIDESRIRSVIVESSSGKITTLSSGDYTIEDGKFTFKSGQVEIGDIVKIKVAQ